MRTALLIAGGLVVGYAAVWSIAVTAFLAADAINNARYRRNPNGAHEPAMDDTYEWVAPHWLRLPGDEETTT